MFEKLEENEFPKKIIFSDEAAFHVSGKLNKQNVRIWGSEHPRATVQHIRESPKVNMWCGFYTVFWLDPFSLPKRQCHPAVAWICWKTFVYPPLQKLQPTVSFRQDGAA
jgi:hypothetical protein